MSDYRDIIVTMATRYGFDPDLLEAQVMVESSGHADAFRFEPGIWQELQQGRLHPAVPMDLTKVVPRRVASSYGLMQVLYVVAMDYGFRDEPERLFIPELGLAFGCTHLRALLRRCGDIWSALASYNGGIRGNGPTDNPKRNQAYVDRVVKAKAQLLGGLR